MMNTSGRPFQACATTTDSSARSGVSEESERFVKESELQPDLVEDAVVRVGEPQECGCHRNGGNGPGQCDERPPQSPKIHPLIEQDGQGNCDDDLEEDGPDTDDQAVREARKEERARKPGVVLEPDTLGALLDEARDDDVAEGGYQQHQQQQEGGDHHDDPRHLHRAFDT